MPLTLRETLLSMKDATVETVTIPEWGNREVRVRSLTAAERDHFERRVLKSGDDISGLKALLATMTVVDDDNERVFTEADIPALQGKNAAVLDRVWQTAQRLSNLLDEDVETLAGN